MRNPHLIPPLSLVLNHRHNRQLHLLVSRLHNQLHLPARNHPFSRLRLPPLSQVLNPARNRAAIRHHSRVWFQLRYLHSSQLRNLLCSQVRSPVHSQRINRLVSQLRSRQDAPPVSLLECHQGNQVLSLHHSRQLSRRVYLPCNLLRLPQVSPARRPVGSHLHSHLCNHRQILQDNQALHRQCNPLLNRIHNPAQLQLPAQRRSRPVSHHHAPVGSLVVNLPILHRGNPAHNQRRCPPGSQLSRQRLSRLVNQVPYPLPNPQFSRLVCLAVHHHSSQLVNQQGSHPLSHPLSQRNPPLNPLANRLLYLPTAPHLSHHRSRVLRLHQNQVRVLPRSPHRSQVHSRVRYPHELLLLSHHHNHRSFLRHSRARSRVGVRLRSRLFSQLHCQRNNQV